jgi:hypothetical protein
MLPRFSPFQVPKGLVLVLLALAARPAWAWGEKGHVIIDAIADRHLTEQARAGIREILGDRSIADGRLASWADEIKRSAHYRRIYPHNDRWHFVDIPFAAHSFDPERDCWHHNCVVQQLPRFVRILADKNSDPEKRKEALLFVLHLVGDLHQPLHCAERNGDHGGTLLTVEYPRHTDEELSLHFVWDENLVNAGIERRDLREYARDLDADITPEQISSWSKGHYRDWAWETHRVAVQSAYRDADGRELPASGTVILDRDYVRKNKEVVREQLRKAGIRLAKVLNDAFQPQ